MIKIENLSKRYAEDSVLDIDALEIPAGEIFGLVGNNGAGKTTLFSLLLDLIMPTTGKVLNHEVQVNISEDWKPYTAAFIDESFLIGYLTPEEYFYFIGELRGMNKQDVSEFLLPFEDFFHGEILGGKKYLRDLSKGNQKKVGIIASFLGRPKVIILDEPFANLDPTTQIRLKKIIAQYKDDPEVTLLISSHDLLHVTEVCQRIVVLNKGKVVRDTKTSDATLRELESFFAEEIQSAEGE
ncbi:ABC transporter ATP-binding protein [Echinicola vietnamensis]|uniref:ABC-type multidrug transport system, ATPase component n=1 Tax=Echinicola vietnamensis (strain DSM 17526 / LMG 23754 / KMM 6221) TaxID=926556 RepID=L0FZ42_ECHVK|nr:ABC transporter ATP-binding protein [Echinicola vietnamensis]AGA78552.1 ABC-type multidrug transport system, ATPase component [Echinicola vietnamensis DSM 17526]